MRLLEDVRRGDYRLDVGGIYRKLIYRFGFFFLLIIEGKIFIVWNVVFF